MRRCGVLLHAILGKRFACLAISAAVLCWSASGAVAGVRGVEVDGSNPISVPEISISGAASLLILLLGAAAVVVESKSTPTRKR